MLNFESNKIADPINYNTVLNPKLWDKDRLKGSVKGALLRMAEDFKQYCDIPFDVQDIIITGANANYNYTNSSDLDLHLIVDFDQIECDREAQELFDTKRRLYKKEHDLEIYGIPVELYVEPQNQPVKGSTYSILDDKWIRPPRKDMPRYDPKELTHWVTVWHKILKTAMQTGDLQTLRNAVKLLRQYRQLGLNTDQAEFSIPNLVFKSLRNDKTLEAAQIMIDRLHDQKLNLI